MERPTLVKQKGPSNSWLLDSREGSNPPYSNPRISAQSITVLVSLLVYRVSWIYKQRFMNLQFSPLATRGFIRELNPVDTQVWVLVRHLYRPRRLLLMLGATANDGNLLFLCCCVLLGHRSTPLTLSRLSQSNLLNSHWSVRRRRPLHRRFLSQDLDMVLLGVVWWPDSTKLIKTSESKPNEIKITNGEI